MEQNNRNQIPILANLSDELLIANIAVLGKMMNIKLPLFKPGMNKTKYATEVMEKVEAAAKSKTMDEAKIISGQIIDRIKNENPGAWSIITGKLKAMGSIFNFKNRKN